MTLVAFVSARSPGLTTTVHALAAVWPARRRAIVAELNPEGGSLVARHELPPEPGLTTLAAAGRRGLTPGTVMQHCRPLPGGPMALLGPIASDQAVLALSVLGPHLAAALDQVPDADVLADCGRIDATSPALAVIRSATRVLMVVTPTLEDVACAQSRLEALELAAGQLGLITIGSRPYRSDQVGAALQLPVIGSVAHDLRGSRDLHSGRVSGRSQLFRSATRLAMNLAGYLPPAAIPAVAPAESPTNPRTGSPRPVTPGFERRRRATRHGEEYEARAGRADRAGDAGGSSWP